MTPADIDAGAIGWVLGAVMLAVEKRSINSSNGFVDFATDAIA